MPHLVDDQLLAESVFTEKKFDACSKLKSDTCSNPFLYEKVLKSESL